MKTPSKSARDHLRDDISPTIDGLQPLTIQRHSVSGEPVLVCCRARPAVGLRLMQFDNGRSGELDPELLGQFNSLWCYYTQLTLQKVGLLHMGLTNS